MNRYTLLSDHCVPKFKALDEDFKLNVAGITFQGGYQKEPD